MQVTLRGVRGGIAVPSPDTAVYGGNTACVEVRTEDGVLLFLDAGTGLRGAGENLPDSGETHVFISHGHADHILGLWFFKPVHSPGWVTHLYLPDWLSSLPEQFFQCGLFPVPFYDVKGKVARHTVRAGETFRILSPSASRAGKAAPVIQVEAFAAHHPGGGLGYRVRAEGRTLVYTGDHEITAVPEAKAAAEAMLRGADLAVVDAQYGRKDYRPGFGHSAWEDWLDASARAGVGRLAFTHHDPARSDAELQALDAQLRTVRKEDAACPALAAREGQCFSLSDPCGRDSENIREVETPSVTTRTGRRKTDRLLPFLEELAAGKDTSSTLDRILVKAREITRADAGTVFLNDGDELVFAYTHNDSLFSADEAHRHAYAAIRLPVSEKSIAGYVAVTGRTLNLPDVRAIPPGAPYAFNDAFDRKTNFVTKSMLVLPFLDSNLKNLGVLQLINSLHPHDNSPCPFSADMEESCRILTQKAAGILERIALEKKGIYGILRMAEVHDPAETGPHAERVGAIAAELYHAWALNRGYDLDSTLHKKGCLRLAAMLHDIGKVGVRDSILKKSGRLTNAEFGVICGHTALGASILTEEEGEIASLASDIAMHHHQKWNGTGYAGYDEEGKLSGEDIPLGARITAIADVFDALVSNRCYKQPWTFEAALGILRREAGTHFDPNLVEILSDIEALLHPIYAAFPDEKR